jgi:hypothetical protein
MMKMIKTMMVMMKQIMQLFLKELLISKKQMKLLAVSLPLMEKRVN